MTQPLHINSPSDLIELTPFLLGCTPPNTPVVYGITNIGLAGPVMTMPLPADPTQWRPVTQAPAPEFMHSNRDRGIDILDIVASPRRPAATLRDEEIEQAQRQITRPT